MMSEKDNTNKILPQKQDTNPVLQKESQKTNLARRDGGCARFFESQQKGRSVVLYSDNGKSLPGLRWRFALTSRDVFPDGGQEREGG